ncbi:GNAT family N-acetyltransferase [Rhizobiales bacterium RZME27]|uniref:GNAT family N-acetyltransferase n=1 Tax=Endobacterium cereale TaxID=2663029 RepID=A0A6A8A8D8_9HYPH|nr:GNAT family N-acetyltransferase [Endobacterium cereale]MEB2844440.1 GNAT family N-acetyltransferase [Endobacterium cereale]MQY47029.1 GNAT family N-acetyltransferase [Endobacterium cereale]
MKTLNPSDITIVDLGPADAAEAQRLSLQEAWPHRLEDWQFLLDISKGVGAICNGKLVGTALLTPYGETGATCNMIIVDPAMRGLGLGRKLVERLLEKAGDLECRLIATEAGLPLYEKLGFVATGKIRQHQGVVTAKLSFVGVIDATPGDLDDLVALDRVALGLDRSALVAKLIDKQPFLLLRDKNGLRGFASCRPFGRGHILGPLVARDDEAFKILLTASIARHHGKFLRVDLTDAAAAEVAVVEAAGLAKVGGGVAMTRPGIRSAEPVGDARVYALAAQALC